MSGVNKVIIIGRLGQPPETRYTKSGDPVCSFSVATSEKWKNKQGEPQEDTQWHSITAFGKLAEICGQYLNKGSQVYIEGSLKTDSYEKDGIKRYSTKIIARSMQMLDSKQTSGHPEHARNQGQQTKPVPDSEMPDFDDLPF